MCCDSQQARGHTPHIKHQVVEVGVCLCMVGVRSLLVSEHIAPSSMLAVMRMSTTPCLPSTTPSCGHVYGRTDTRVWPAHRNAEPWRLGLPSTETVRTRVIALLQHLCDDFEAELVIVHDENAEACGGEALPRRAARRARIRVHNESATTHKIQRRCRP